MELRLSSCIVPDFAQGGREGQRIRRFVFGEVLLAVAGLGVPAEFESAELETSLISCVRRRARK